jgi:hypothetical protein
MLMQEKPRGWIVRVYVSSPGQYIEFEEPVAGFPSEHLKNQILLLAG